ncbi:MAG: hypothetical protein SGJ00_07625 [bacterium]|nr:hypothetical protein [bacterium]
MKNLETLNQTDREKLLKFPAYISLLASNNDTGLDEVGRAAAIKFSHIKTFSCDPMLFNFYQQANQVFEDNITTLDMELPEKKAEREDAIKLALEELETILKKLGKNYAIVMHRSMKSFKDHISKSHHSVLESFIFPIPIKGLTY